MNARSAASGGVFASLLLTAGGWVAAQGPGQPAPADRPPAEQFPVACDGDALLLPVRVGGAEHQFVVDTGSVLTVYDKSLLPGRPGHVTSVETTTGVKDIDLYDAPDARIGGLSLRGGPHVLGSDLTMLRYVSGHDIRGVIGMDFLDRHVVRIDFEAGILSVLDSPGREPGAPFRIWRQKEGPCVDVAVGGLDRPERFLIDTGSTYFGNMKKAALEELAGRGKARRVGESFTEGLGGAEANGKWAVESLAVGPFRHRDVVLTQTRDNLLGLGFFSAYVVTLDFPNNVLYLKRHGRPCQPNLVDRSGLHLLRVGGKTMVHSVDAGSPAAAGGVRANDVLASLDGESTDGVSMLTLRRRLCAEGKVVRMTFARGPETIEITTTLGWSGRSATPGAKADGN